MGLWYLYEQGFPISKYNTVMHLSLTDTVKMKIS